MEKYTCEICGLEGIIDSLKEPHFKCKNCGHERNFIFRRELVDLSDPMEGPMVLRIAAGSLK